MAIERLVGLHVTDDALYQQYREAMLPILKQHGGGFGYDFKIAEVLQSEVDQNINRLFTIYFESEKLMDDFFKNEKYLVVRNQYYVPAVSATTIISKYSR
ncbi:hypothetical protein MNBD_GAMMA22-2500 [hydrothermal vent metagenome]|uniref:DUF1330 domain-containing protein n=1 Tax=hydrothermal vent metagenome TaxID=652676 RepID=A0A3B1AWQ8_9ZZZZ